MYGNKRSVYADEVVLNRLRQTASTARRGFAGWEYKNFFVFSKKQFSRQATENFGIK